MAILLAIYILIGAILGAPWSGAAALRHVRGLVTFLFVTVAWPVFILGLFAAVRNY